MEKFNAIYKDIETATNQEVIKQRKISFMAIGVIILSVTMAVGGYMIEDGNSTMTTLLFTVAVCGLIGGVIKISMGHNYYMFRPTGSRIDEITLYFDARESAALQNCIESRRFDDLKRLKRQTNTGVKVDAMIANDKKFVAVQISTFIPYTYEPICPVMCYYGDEAGMLAGNLK